MIRKPEETVCQRRDDGDPGDPRDPECRDIVKVREQEIRREIKNQSQKEESLVKSKLKKICSNVHVEVEASLFIIFFKMKN